MQVAIMQQANLTWTMFGHVVTFAPVLARKLDLENTKICAGASRHKFFFYSFENTKFFQFFLHLSQINFFMQVLASGIEDTCSAPI